MTIDKRRARSLVYEANASLAYAYDCVAELWTERAWTVLGYDSWESLCDSEFAGLRGNIGKADRKRLISVMTGDGMSTRAQAAALGTSEATVRRTQVRQDDAPAEVTGTDGKRYTATPRRPQLAVVEAVPLVRCAVTVEADRVDALRAVRGVVDVHPLDES